MRAFLPLLATASLLAACDVPGEAVPVAARLSQENLTVTLSDRRTCTAFWVGAPTGPLAGCPGLTYRVAVVENPNLLRKLISEATEALQAEGVLAPMAEVSVFAGNRKWRFVTPPPE